MSRDVSPENDKLNQAKREYPRYRYQRGGKYIRVRVWVLSLAGLDPGQEGWHNSEMKPQQRRRGGRLAQQRECGDGLFRWCALASAKEDSPNEGDSFICHCETEKGIRPEPGDTAPLDVSVIKLECDLPRDTPGKKLFHRKFQLFVGNGATGYLSRVVIFYPRLNSRRGSDFWSE